MRMFDTDVGSDSGEMKVLNFRVPASTVEMIAEVKRLRRLLAEAEGDDPQSITDSATIRRMLRKGAEAEFDKVGGWPKDEKGWALLEQQINKAAKR